MSVGDLGDASLYPPVTSLLGSLVGRFATTALRQCAICPFLCRESSSSEMCIRISDRASLTAMPYRLGKDLKWSHTSLSFSLETSIPLSRRRSTTRVPITTLSSFNE